MFNLKEKLDEDFSETIWGDLILKDLLEEIVENKLKLDKIFKNLRKYPELEKYALTILNDKEELEKIENILKIKENTWEKVYIASKDFSFEKWPIDKKVTTEYKNEAKEMRDKIKKSINTTFQKVMIYNSKEANEIIYQMYPILNSIKNLVLEFEEEFQNKKKEKNRIDFHDIEHFALKILLKENKNN